MRLTSLDWTILVGSIVASFIPPLWMACRSGLGTVVLYRETPRMWRE